MLKHLKYDLPASLAVFFVAISLCLGIAHASGAPLIAGLITGAVGGLIVGFLSGSQLSVSGPAAGLTTIVLAAIAESGSYENFLVAVALAGIIQIAMGSLKLGVIANYIPNNVIKGMLSAIGVLLIMKQFPHMVGYDIEEMGVEEFSVTQEDLNTTYHDSSDKESNTITILLHTLYNLKGGVFIIGFSSLAFLFAWNSFFAKKAKAIPGSLLVVVLGVLLDLVLDHFPDLSLNADHLVNIPAIKSWSDFDTHASFPSWEVLNRPLTYKIAFTIALVASIETLLSVEAIDKLDPEHRKTPPNRELIAQGIGNTLAALLGGIPMTAVIVRGSVNIAAGARSKLSAMLHGAFIVLSTLYFSGLINKIPLASLASILVYTGFKLIDLKSFVLFYKKGWSQLVPFAVTILAIVFTDLLIGVSLGLIVAGFYIVHNNYKAPVVQIIDMGMKKRIVLGENVSFLHKNTILKIFESIKDNSTLEIDASKNLFIDRDIVDSIYDFQNTCKNRNIKFYIGGLLKMDKNTDEVKQQMVASYERLLKGNKRWVETKTQEDPGFFSRQVEGQAPEYLFIGCSDSRVPANEITGTEPGEMFVHRNIANMVVNTDVNLMSVVQYSVEVLNVKHIIVCGHYGCGGVKASLDPHPHGLIDKWLRNIKDVYRLHREELDAIPDENTKLRKLVELNVREQVYNLMKTSFVQRNKQQYGFPDLHGWVYDISNGVVIDLKVDEDEEFREYQDIYKMY